MIAKIKKNANFVVRSINKDGSISKMVPTSLSYARTQEQAEKIKSDREVLNPGKQFAVFALANDGSNIETTNSCTVDLRFTCEELAKEFFIVAPGHGLAYDNIARKTVEGNTTWAEELERLARSSRGVTFVKVYRYSVNRF